MVFVEIHTFVLYLICGSIRTIPIEEVGIVRYSIGRIREISFSASPIANVQFSLRGETSLSNKGLLDGIKGIALCVICSLIVGSHIDSDFQHSMEIECDFYRNLVSEFTMQTLLLHYNWLFVYIRRLQNSLLRLWLRRLIGFRDVGKLPRGIQKGDQVTRIPRVTGGETFVTLGAVPSSVGSQVAWWQSFKTSMRHGNH